MISLIGNGKTLAELHKMTITTPPGAGSRWCPIPHAELAETVRAGVLARGWGIEKEVYATGRGDADFAGALLLHGVPGVVATPGTMLSLGMVSSNARRHALKLTVGASVLVCCNGLCTGAMLIRRLHDHTVALSDDIGRALDAFPEQAAWVPRIIDGLRDRYLSCYGASEILMEAGRQRLLGWTAIGQVDAVWRKPTHAEYGKGTSWTLYSAFTEVAARHVAPVRQMATTLRFLEMLPKEVSNG